MVARKQHSRKKMRLRPLASAAVTLIFSFDMNSLWNN
jgi:hypothetical protein